MRRKERKERKKGKKGKRNQNQRALRAQAESLPTCAIKLFVHPSSGVELKSKQTNKPTKQEWRMRVLMSCMAVVA